MPTRRRQRPGGASTSGSPRLRDPSPELAILRLASGPTLFLWQTDSDTTANFDKNGEAMPAVGLETDDIAAMQAHLESIGATITLWHIDPEAGTFLKFLDPRANMLVVHQDPRPGS